MNRIKQWLISRVENCPDECYPFKCIGSVRYCSTTNLVQRSHDCYFVIQYPWYGYTLYMDRSGWHTRMMRWRLDTGNHQE